MFALLLSLVVGLLSTSDAGGPPMPGPPVTKRILIVGDSQACAMKWGAAKFVRRPTEKVDIFCKGGTRTSYWEGAHMKEALAGDRYDEVIVFLGSNDYGNRPDPTKVVARIKEAGVKKCVWTGPPLIRGQRSVTNDHLKRTVAPCAYLDAQEIGVPLDPNDKVHPTPTGAVLWLSKAWALKDSIPDNM